MKQCCQSIMWKWIFLEKKYFNAIGFSGEKNQKDKKWTEAAFEALH